jgi:phage gpG-like protein
MLSVTGESIGNASEQLQAMAARLTATRPLVTAMAEHSAEGQRRNIDERHAPDGSAYPELSPFTIARKLRYGRFGEAPLKTSGTMFESIHPEVLNDEEATAGPFGLVAYYYAYQNQGTSRRGNFHRGQTVTPGIPARAFIGVSPLDYATFEADALEFAMAAVGGGQ